jgi:hypothetical protein
MTTPPTRAAASGAEWGRGLGSRLAGAASRPAGAGLLELLQLVTLNQVVAPWLDRVQMAGLDVPADGHMADTEQVGRLRNRQQVITVHAAQDSANDLHHNMTSPYTGSKKTCILR